MKSKSSKAVQPVMAPTPIGSKSSNLDTARMNLQAQVASGGINQSQADAEYNRLRGLGAKQINSGNLAAAQTMSAPPPSYPMVQQSQAAQAPMPQAPMQAMLNRQPMTAQSMPNQASMSQMMSNAGMNAQMPYPQPQQQLNQVGLSSSTFQPQRAPNMGAAAGGFSPQYLQLARALIGQGSGRYPSFQPSNQQPAQNMPSMFGGIKPFGS